MLLDSLLGTPVPRLRRPLVPATTGRLSAHAHRTVPARIDDPHVVDHLVDPAAMLGAISARLAKGGKLFITAPFRPTGWRPSHGIRGWREYSYLHVPAHITYFSRRWLERTAPMHGMKVAHWNADHEEGQAFELVLVRA